MTAHFLDQRGALQPEGARGIRDNTVGPMQRLADVAPFEVMEDGTKINTRRADVGTFDRNVRDNRCRDGDADFGAEQQSVDVFWP